VGEYTITPHSDSLIERANSMYAQHRNEIEAERELRRRRRQTLL